MSRQLILVLCSILLCTGCVDTESKFNDFARRVGTKEGGTVGDASTCTVAPNSVHGQYLLAISVVIAPTKPIVALTDLTTPPLNGGAGLSLDAQPLLASDRQTPTGPKIALGPFPIDSQGGFVANIPGLQVTGLANPVTGGDITADVVLTGNLCGDGRFFCGTVTGQVQKPTVLNLQGSTFTLTRVDVDAGAFPTRPAIDCAGDLADSL